MSKPWEKYQADGPWSKYRKDDGDLDLDSMRSDAEIENSKKANVITAASNVPSSAVEFGKDMATPFIHPIQTVKGLWNLAQGVADKAGLDLDGESQEIYADAVWQMMKERYGSTEAIANTFNTDPVGMLADIAGGAGLVARMGKVARIPGSDTAMRVSAAADPVNLAANTAKTAANAATRRNLPQDWYEEVAKFSTTLSPDERSKLVNTALDNKLEPTPKGADRLSSLVDGLNSQVQYIIDTADSADTRVPASVVISKMNELRNKRGGFKKNAKTDLEAIDGEIEAFNELVAGLTDDAGNPRDWVTVRELQDYKTDRYDDINWRRANQQGEKIGSEIDRTLASGAREGIEQVDPSVRDINRQMGDLLELQPHLERSGARIGNRNMLGLQTPMVATGAGAAGGPEAAAMAGVASFLFNPQNKAKIAIALHHLKNGNRSWLNNNVTNQQMRYITALAGRSEQELEALGLLQEPQQ